MVLPRKDAAPWVKEEQRIPGVQAVKKKITQKQRVI